MAFSLVLQDAEGHIRSLAPSQNKDIKTVARSPHPPKRPPKKDARPDRPRARVEPLAGLAARKAAVDILGRVLRAQRPLDEELDAEHGHPGVRDLDAQDRSLLRALLGTALRHRGQIGAILDHLLDRPIPDKSGAAMDILHIAAAQILFMEVADHAAVSLAVTLADQDRKARTYKGLVNAVLRRMARDAEDLRTRFNEPWRNTPVWLFATWQKAFGAERALQTAAMHLHTPNLDLTVKSDPDGWATRLGGRRIAGNSIRLADHSGRVDRLDGFEEGAWWVQDAAAALPARLLGDVAGKRVADLCAAPGGKTAQLAAAGATVTAVDISARRLARLRANLDRLSLSAEVRVSDLRSFEPEAPFDAILLDAPCSATGTIRRHPDVAWSKRPEDIAMLAQIQAELLQRVSGWLVSGGTLVYCTCSLQPEEGEAQIAAFLAANPGFVRQPVSDEEIGIPGAITEAGDLRTLPCLLPSTLPGEPERFGGLDGFFAARLKRL